MRELVINSTVQHTLLLFIPLVFAIILKVAKLRSWSLLAGVLGGILLGPAVFGSVVPEYWEGLFQGGTLQKQQYELLERQQEADILAARTLGASDSVLLHLQADYHYELSVKKELWDTAIWSDQRTLRDYSIALIVLIFLSGSVRNRVKRTAPPLMSLSVGVWAAIVPCGIVVLIAIWFWNSSISNALALGACLAAGPWTLARWEQRAADNSEKGGSSLMLGCGRVAWIVASCIAFYATWQLRGAMTLVWLLPLLLLPFIWIVPLQRWRWLTVFVDYAAIPSVMAASLVLINPLEHLQFWPILVVILFCADARWLGGMIGLGLLGGRKSGDAMRLSIPLVDAGVSQLCMVSLLFGVGVIPAPYAVAALIGAIFLDYTAPIRLKMSQKNPQGK